MPTGSMRVWRSQHGWLRCSRTSYEQEVRVRARSARSVPTVAEGSGERAVRGSQRCADRVARKSAQRACPTAPLPARHLVVPIRADDARWLVLWRHDPEDADLIQVHYVGPAPGEL